MRSDLPMSLLASAVVIVRLLVIVFVLPFFLVDLFDLLDDLSRTYGVLERSRFFIQDKHPERSPIHLADALII